MAVETDDKWCIDPRGVLTLCVSKVTYQRLGLVGSKLPFKDCAEQYSTFLPSGFDSNIGSSWLPSSAAIRIPLCIKSESVGMIAKRKKALQDWDRRREEDGLGKWDVLCCDPSSSDLGTRIAHFAMSLCCV